MPDENTLGWERPLTWATFADLSLRSPDLTPSDEPRATAYLEDATALIDSELDLAGITLEEQPSDSYLARLRAVCCRVCLRALAGSMDGVKGYSLGADVFKESWEYSNPSGDLYLTETDRKELGITSGGIEQFFPYSRQWGVSDD